MGRPLVMLLLAFSTVTVVADVHAQRARAGEPRRPTLTATADTNDAEAYYGYGLVNFSARSRDAGDAFYWATRLDPHHAEAMYGLWAAFWMSNTTRFIRYVIGDPLVANDRDIIRNDSLIYRAFMLNPLLHRALDLRIEEQAVISMGHRINWTTNDPFMRGWIHYSRGEMGPAVEQFRHVVQRRRRDQDAGRLYLARAHFHMGNSDSAAHHFGMLLEAMRKKDEKKIVFWYESKALMEYRIGHIYAAGNRLEEAREAYGRALVEDLSFYMSHARLGEIARVQRDTLAAVDAYAIAVDLRGEDAVLRAAYGAALVDAGRADDAEEHLRKAVELEPYYATAYYELARSLDRQNRAAEAIATYGLFLERAPRSRTREITLARRRMTALRTVAAGGE